MSHLRKAIEIRGGTVQETNIGQQLVLPLSFDQGVQVQVQMAGDDDDAVFNALLKAEKVFEATKRIDVE